MRLNKANCRGHRHGNSGSRAWSRSHATACKGSTSDAVFSRGRESFSGGCSRWGCLSRSALGTDCRLRAQVADNPLAPCLASEGLIPLQRSPQCLEFALGLGAIHPGPPVARTRDGPVARLRKTTQRPDNQGSAEPFSRPCPATDRNRETENTRNESGVPSVQAALHRGTEFIAEAGELLFGQQPLRPDARQLDQGHRAPRVIERGGQLLVPLCDPPIHSQITVAAALNAPQGLRGRTSWCVGLPSSWLCL